MIKFILVVFFFCHTFKIPNSTRLSKTGDFSLFTWLFFVLRSLSFSLSVVVGRKVFSSTYHFCAFKCFFFKCSNIKILMPDVNYI